MCDRDQCVMKGDIKEAANVLDALDIVTGKQRLNKLGNSWFSPKTI